MRTHRQVGFWTDGWMGRLTNEWVNGWIKEWRVGERKNLKNVKTYCLKTEIRQINSKYIFNICLTTGRLTFVLIIYKPQVPTSQRTPFVVQRQCRKCTYKVKLSRLRSTTVVVEYLLHILSVCLYSCLPLGAELFHSEGQKEGGRTDGQTDLPTYLPTYIPTYLHTYVHTYKHT